MKHFDSCRCDSCRREHKCAPPSVQGGFLMQQIQGSGRVFLRCERFSLCIGGIPDSACPPFQILEVCARQCSCESALEEDSCGCPAVLAHIPLILRLRDKCGCCFTGSAAICVRIPLRPVCPPQELWRHQLVVCASARLAMPCQCMQCECAELTLDVCAQAWAVCCRALCAPVCQQDCPPPLPLYPQPCRPPHPPHSCC